MGFFKDFVKNPVKTVKKEADKVVKNPGRAIKKGAGQIYGAGSQLANPVLSIATGSNAGRKFLQNPIVDRLTFGYSGDAVDFTRVTGKLARGSEVDNRDWQGAGRFAIKSAAIGGATAAFYSTAPSAAKSAVQFATANPYSTFTAAQLGAGAVSSGDYSQLVSSAVAGGGNWLAPGLGDDLKGLFPSKPSAGPSYGAPSAFPSQGFTDSNEAPSKPGAIPWTAISIGVLAIGALTYLAKRKGA